MSGTTGYKASDRKLFPAMTKLIKSGNARSYHDAASMLVNQNKVAGRAAPENKAKRLSTLYRQECATDR